MLKKLAGIGLGLFFVIAIIVAVARLIERPPTDQIIDATNHAVGVQNTIVRVDTVLVQNARDGVVIAALRSKVNSAGTTIVSLRQQWRELQSEHDSIRVRADSLTIVANLNDQLRVATTLTATQDTVIARQDTTITMLNADRLSLANTLGQVRDTLTRYTQPMVPLKAQFPTGLAGIFKKLGDHIGCSGGLGMTATGAAGPAIACGFTIHL